MNSERRQSILTPETDPLYSIKQEILIKKGLEQFIGEADVLLKTVNHVKMLSEKDTSVLLTGETGTGKEMCARAIHYMGKRAAFPFIPVNCGSLTEQLFENELFGHVKGAYTGAAGNHAGIIYEANKGTLFLDEINSLSMTSQVKLLRFLEDRAYRPVGSAKYIECDVRIISATNIDLSSEIEQRRFREDLYYRINVFQLHLPPLRERIGDIPLLVRHYLDKFSVMHQRTSQTVSVEGMAALCAYQWPGNVRELKNLMEKLSLTVDSEIIEKVQLGKQFQQIRESSPCYSFKEEKESVLKIFEQKYLQRLLEQHKWNVSLAAKVAHISRRTMHRMIKKYRLQEKHGI